MERKDTLALEAMQYRGGLFLRADEPTEDGTPGLIHFVASTEEKATDSGIIKQSGWDLRFYRRNPLFLWAHNSNGLCGGSGGAPLHPIGRSEATDLRLGDDAGELGDHLEIGVRFDEGIDERLNAPINPMAYLTAHQYRSGYLAMVSVGFRVLMRKDRADYEEGHKFHGEDGWVAEEARLYEVSAVPIGADANAFQLGRHGGRSLAEVARHFLETPDGRAILDLVVRENLLRMADEQEKAGRGFFGLKRHR